MHLLEPIENWTSFMVEPLEARVMLSAALPLGFVLPTPMGNSVPLVVPTPAGIVLGLKLSLDVGSYLTRLADDGQVDLTFGERGRVILPGVGTPEALIVVPGGDLLLLARDQQGGGVSLLRFHPDGRPDAAFGDAGRVTLPLRATARSAMAVMGDGRIVVAEPLAVQPPPVIYAPGDGIGLFRFTPGGRPDDSFGDRGFARLPLAGEVEGVASVRADPAGGLSLLATPWNAAGLWLIQTDATGSPDPARGDGGAITLGDAYRPDSSVLADGTIMVVETDYHDGLHLSRFTADGRPDPTFAGGGRLNMNRDAALVWGCAPILGLPDGTLVITYDQSGLAGDHLMALAHDGSPLRTFARGAGTIDVPRPGADWDANDLEGAAVDERGRIVTAVFLHAWNAATGYGGTALEIARFRSDGTLDATFGADGSEFLMTDFILAAPPPAAEPVDREPPAPTDDNGDVATGAGRPVASDWPFNIEPADDADAALFGLTPERSLLGKPEDDVLLL